MSFACVKTGRECDGCGGCWPRPVDTCDGCGGDICENEDYWAFDGTTFCGQCINDARRKAE